MSEHHFGWNCKCFNPSNRLCSKLIEDVNQNQFVDYRWFPVKEVRSIFDINNERIFSACVLLEGKFHYDGEMNSKKAKVRLPDYKRFASCPLIETGGQCMYFHPHDGEKIDAIIDLRLKFPFWEPEKPRLV